MLTILHTESSTGWGGQEIRILQESLGMIKRGYRIIIATPMHSSIFKKAKDSGIEAVPASFEKKRPHSFLEIISIINKEKIDIVNTHSSSDSWVATVAARLSSVKPAVIRTRHLSTPVGKSFLSRLIYNVLPDAVITTGEAIKERMIHYNRFNAEKIFSIPTGVDIKRFDPDKVKPCIPKKSFLIGSIGVLRNWKGHRYLLEAAPIISDYIPDASFYIVGDGPQYNNLKKITERMNIQNKVIFTGYRKDIPEILASIDVVVHPSYESEGIPQSILQAMAMKKPIIASDAGSIKEVVINKKTGFLINPKDPHSIADKVIELYNNPQMRTDFGYNARRFVEENHTIDIMIGRIEALYESIIKKRRGV